MRTAPPPENLPAEPPFGVEELARLREAYRLDFGGAEPTDEELITLARETIRILVVLGRIAAAQAARRNEQGQ
jgi:hypothetical protein